MRMGFVFTNYNNTHFSEQLLESLNQIDGIEQCHIVFVDNNSNETDRRRLEKVAGALPYVTVICSAENLGYFRGLNAGLNLVRAEHPAFDHVVIGNNDLIFGPDFIETIANNATTFARYPIVAPDIVTASGEHQNPHVIKKTGLLRECLYDLYYSNYQLSRAMTFLTNRLSFTKRTDHTRHDQRMEIHQGYGACYVLGPVFFEHFDALWAPTFLMGEEYFLSLQVERKGFLILYEPSIKVFHCEKAATRKVPRREMWDIARESHKVYREHKRRTG